MNERVPLASIDSRDGIVHRLAEITVPVFSHSVGDPRSRVADEIARLGGARFGVALQPARLMEAALAQTVRRMATTIRSTATVGAATRQCSTTSPLTCQDTRTWLS